MVTAETRTIVLFVISIVSKHFQKVNGF